MTIENVKNIYSGEKDEEEMRQLIQTDEENKEKEDKVMSELEEKRNRSKSKKQKKIDEDLENRHLKTALRDILSKITHRII